MVLLSAILLAGVVTPSHAATPCPTGKYCVWADSDRSGPGLILSVHHHRVTNAIGNQLNDAVSSAENQTPFTVYFFVNRNGKGMSLCLGSGNTYTDFSAFSFNDMVSSSKAAGHTLCI